MKFVRLAHYVAHQIALTFRLLREDFWREDY
jgi:hypothetical protein